MSEAEEFPCSHALYCACLDLVLPILTELIATIGDQNHGYSGGCEWADEAADRAQTRLWEAKRR